jgi:membrane protease YdiL (CAAX protease family)
MLLIRILLNLIPVIFGIIAIRKWKKAKLRKNEIGQKLGFIPFLKFQLLIGLLIGAIIFSLVFATFLSFNLLTIIQFSWTNGNLVKILLILTVAAIIEEIIFRSFFINGLKLYLKSTTLIILITALFFGVVHMLNEDSTILSTLSAFIGGIMYAFAFIITEKLWLPVGLHFSWNFFQGFVYGFPVSGFEIEGLFKINISGQEFLTGGEYGPEGGFIGIFARFIVVFAIWLIFKFNKASNKDS